ncbi:MAG: TerB family tellurite resistance protein [Lentimicrobiaceae bacterium]|nr:TerB family tellurite resistance protein [Lentimicrobiaceae bacterium]MBE6346339.1 TerB family tellurite resistance protein [Lentimicrobiaceae bacterium]
MNTDIKHIAALVASAIWADGEYDEAEKIVVGEIAEAFELDAALFAQEIDAAVAELGTMDEEQVNNYILEHSAEVDDDEAAMLYEAALQIITIDGVVGVEEIDNVLAIASALGLDEAQAVLLFADLIREEPEIELAY